MQQELSTEEKEQVVYAGKFMLYMQALRFLTDYLNNDVYYGSAYEGRNLVRANNQITLLQRLSERETDLKSWYKNHNHAPIADSHLQTFSKPHIVASSFSVQPLLLQVTNTLYFKLI